MNPNRYRILIPVLLIALLLAAPESVFACATCFGTSDSPLAQGMNWGIITLLGVVFSVLGGLTAFFIFIARRARTMAAGSSIK